MQKQQLLKFKKTFQKVQNVAIVTHFNPDGDALGSSLALYHLLLKLGKKPRVIVPNPYPDFLSWLPGSNRILTYSDQEKTCDKVLEASEMLFTLDFNTFKRLEKLGEKLESYKPTKVLIDHHQAPDSFADFSWHNPKATSTCELIFEFISDLKALNLIDKKIAACLYTGLMTDTGSFRYPGVNAKTHRILAALLETGIHPSDIHSAVYDNFSVHRLRLLGYALSEKLRLVEGFPVAYFVLSEKELEKFNYQKGDTEGLVNYPFAIKGIQVSALLNESGDHVKLSLRSKGAYDMNKLARKYFNGGGHINAAGGKSRNSLEETEKLFIEAVKTIF